MKTPISAISQTYTGPEPTNFSDLLRLVAANTTYDWDDTGSVAVVVGTTAPTDLTATWFVQDAAGRPMGMKRFYSGKWRGVYNGPNDHELTYFAGPWASFFDTSGLGLAGLAWEGYCLCLGNHGTPDLRDLFIVAGYRYDGALGWTTKISGADTQRGGANQTLMTLANLPTITWPVKVQQGFLGVGSGHNGVPLGSTDTNAGSGGFQAGNVFGGHLGTQQVITTVPPWVAMAPAMWVGY